MFLNILNYVVIFLIVFGFICGVLWGVVFEKLARDWVQKDIEERYSTKLKVPRFASPAKVNYLPKFVVLYWLLEYKKDSRFYQKRLRKIQSSDNLLKKINYDITTESKRNIVVCFCCEITGFFAGLSIILPLLIGFIIHLFK